MLSRCFLDCSVGVGGFCHRTESDLFLFLLIQVQLQNEYSGFLLVYFEF